MQQKTDLSGDKGDNMKGKTIIELKDVRSGKVQRVEHGNTFQSAVLSSLFKPYGQMDLNLDLNPSQQAWKALVGGLMVFDDTIEVGSMYVPDGVNMVGNGAHEIVNTGVPNELGSWNTSESYVSDSEIVMTYDFTTSQANGTINSVALTSKSGGLIGMGNASQERRSDAVAPLDFTKTPIVSPRLDIFFSNIQTNTFDGEYIYKVIVSTDKVSVSRVWANSSGIDLIRDRGNEFGETTYDISLPNSVVSLSRISKIVALDENRVGMLYNDTANSVYLAVVINIKTRNIDTYQIPILSGVINYSIVGGTLNNCYVYEVYDSSGERRVGIYNTSNSSWEKDVELYISYDIRNIYMIGGRFHYFVKTGQYTTSWFEENNGVLVITNSHSGIDTLGNFSMYLPTLNFMVGFGGNYQQMAFSKYPCYLATINNLEEPVVKDNTKTMKITYVLTRR
jgi:hypothetical protein